VKLLPIHPIRSSLDHLIQECERCEARGFVPDPATSTSIMCERCAGSGHIPVEPLRILLDYLARRIAEASHDTPDPSRRR
jgi:hypothetical protein